jgi:ATP-dependent protease ClpP protease subunit
VPQSFEYFEQIQNRIISFVTNHSKIKEKRLRELLSETEFLTKDIGSVLVGEETVKEGLINEVGGIKEALAKLHEMITNYKQTTDKK